MRKVILLLLLLGMLMAGATGPGLIAGNETSVLELSLDAAKNLALSQNLQMELSRLGVQKAQLKLEEAKSKADQLAKQEDLFGANYDMARGRYVAPRAAEMELNLALQNQAFQANFLKFTVENHYYGLLKAKAALDLAQTALERAREQLRLAEAGYKAGTMAKGEILGAEVLVAAAETEVLAADNGYRIAMMRLNKTLGFPLEQQLVLTGSFEFLEAKPEPADVLPKARDFDLQLMAARETVAVQEVNFQQAKRFYTPNVYAYRQAEYDLAEARSKLVRQEQELEFAVRQSLLNLETAAGAYRVLEQNLEAAREHLRVANLKLSAGVGTRIEAQRAAEELQRVENKMLEALCNYNLAVTAIEHLIFDSGSSTAGGGVR
ncbi:MAG: TolC family protein [Bacillota bacterium]